MKQLTWTAGMSKGSFALLLAILSGSISPAQAAGQPLPEQLQQIEALQRRADTLSFGTPGANNYQLAKARAWLDLALGEYYENEGNAIVPSAIGQAQTLLDALEQKQALISMDTPMQIPGSEAVRPDLWNRIAALKKHEKFSCGQNPVAEAEVQLVWAGHEKLESGWSHAAPYARSAEDLVRQAQTAIDDCVARMPVIKRITLSNDALFAFGQATLEPSALWRLDRLADSIKSVKTLDEVVLTGHADRLRSDGHPERNLLLSERRAETIRQYLVGKGIPLNKIRAFGAGSSQPVVQCSTALSKEQQVICLQPNRRVEIVLRGAK